MFASLAMPLWSQDTTAEVPESQAEIDETTLTFDAEAPDQQNSNDSNIEPDVWDYLRIVVMLALVLGLIYLLYFFLKKFNKTAAAGSNTIITVHETKPLQGNRMLHVVEVAGSMYVVGSTDQHVSKIDKIENQEQIDRIRLEQSKTQAPVSFADALRKMFNPGADSNQNNSNEAETTSSENRTEFMQEQRDRLKNL